MSTMLQNNEPPMRDGGLIPVDDLCLRQDDIYILTVKGRSMQGKEGKRDKR